MQFNHKTTLASLAFMSAIFASPAALAQEDDSAPDNSAASASYDIQSSSGTQTSIYDGDYISLGLGGGIAPSYEGSDNYIFMPVPFIGGSWHGVEFEPRQAGIAFDFIADSPDAKVEVVAGPVGRLRFSREVDTEDAVVDLLPDRNIALELGATVGLRVNQVFHEYDQLSFMVDVTADVVGSHSGLVAHPIVYYFTPLSESLAILLMADAEYTDNDYNDYYFSVTPAESVISGLPVFDADNGFKNIGFNMIGTWDLSGDLRDGGWYIYGGGSYNRMLDDAKDTPLTSIRGDADQWVGFLGIGYTF